MADELLSRDCFNGLTEDNQLYEILKTLNVPPPSISIDGISPIQVTTVGSDSDISILQSGTASNGYLSSTDWNTFNNKTFCITLGHSSTTLAAGGTNTYFANLFDLAPASPSFRRQFKFPFNGTIVAVSMTFYNGGGVTPTGHSGATMSLYNVDTASTVATLISYNVNGVVTQDSFSQIATGLNIPVVANTTYNIFLQGGTFTTNPTSVRQTINLFVR
jgi:hypothetical protein